MKNCMYLVLALTFLSFQSQLQKVNAENNPDSYETAKNALDNFPLIDGHNDLPIVYRNRVDNHVDLIDLSVDVNQQWGPSHTDIPRLREGKVGAQFWSVFVGCGTQFKDPIRSTLEQIDVVYRFVEKYPEDFKLVRNADEILVAFNESLIASLIGVEGGHSMDDSLAVLRQYYTLGVRYMTITHSCNTPWADASLADIIGPEHDGLTDWGKLVIEEMNRLGMLVDLSHVSKNVMIQAIELSKAPVIFSHSNAYSICNIHRNVQDDVLDMLKENDGIIMITFVPFFLNCYPSNKTANIELVADHIEYVKKRIGVDHVGIGGDFDGIRNGPIGLEDVSKYPNLFTELANRGWSQLELEKLAGRNLIRVFKAVENVRDNLATKGIRPIDTLIPEEDLANKTNCRSDF